MSLIVHLARHRQTAGLTQAKLADAVGVSRKTINTVENQVFIPSTLLALKLAAALGLGVHDLFALHDDDRPETIGKEAKT